MKQNRLSITIHKPVDEVFEFTTNPANTPRWVESIKVEEVTNWPIKIGTVYRNKGVIGPWQEYVVSALKPNKFFELTSKNGNYHVRYTYTKFKNNITIMEYFEWVDRGELENPFPWDTLEKLKSVIEKM